MTLAMSARYFTRNPDDVAIPLTFEFCSAMDGAAEDEKLAVAADLACNPKSSAMTVAACVHFGQLKLIASIDPHADFSQLESVNQCRNHIRKLREAERLSAAHL